MNIEYRIAHKREKEALLETLISVYGLTYKNLIQEYIDSMFSDAFRRPTFVVAVKGEEIIGAAAFSEELFTTDVWGIGWVCVKEPYRHKGIGEKLVSQCIKYIKKSAGQAHVDVIIRVYPNKTKLYEKIGFEKLEKLDGSGYFMLKTIDEHVEGAVESHV